LLKNVYLAGAITDVEDPITWRLQARRLLPNGWFALDPTEHQFTDDITAEQLVRIDLEMIDKSHAVVVCASVPSWGTAMELSHAYKRRIPIYAFDAPRPCSPWLTAHVTVFYDSLQEAMARLGTRVRKRRLKEDVRQPSA